MRLPSEKWLATLLRFCSRPERVLALIAVIAVIALAIIAVTLSDGVTADPAAPRQQQQVVVAPTTVVNSVIVEDAASKDAAVDPDPVSSQK